MPQFFFLFVISTNVYLPQSLLFVVKDDADVIIIEVFKFHG